MTVRRNTVLAAVGTGASARIVLATAIEVGRATGAEVEAVHVEEGAGGLDAVAHAALPLRRLTGRTGHALLAALDAEDVIAMVIGAGVTPRGGHPVGETTLHVVTGTSKPVVVVPPAAVAARPIRRFLLPLEGDEASSRPVLDALLPLLAGDVELVVLHAFTEATLPRMLDRPSRDLALLGREFLASHCPPAARIELRSGPVADIVSEVSEEQGIDMVVLGWSQDSSKGRAQVVRAVLSSSSLPVLLLPDRQRDQRP